MLLKELLSKYGSLGVDLAQSRDGRDDVAVSLQPVSHAFTLGEDKDFL